AFVGLPATRAAVGVRAAVHAGLVAAGGVLAAAVGRSLVRLRPRAVPAAAGAVVRLRHPRELDDIGGARLQEQPVHRVGWPRQPRRLASALVAHHVYPGALGPALRGDLHIAAALDHTALAGDVGDPEAAVD